MARATWRIENLKSVLADGEIEGVRTVEEFARRTQIGEPEARDMLCEKNGKLYKYSVAKKIRKRCGENVFQKMCKKPRF